MNDSISPLFDDLRRNNAPLQEYPESLRALLPSQMEVSMNSKKTQNIREFREFISKLLRLSFDAAPQAARHAMANRETNSSERHAYLLGELTFAEAYVISVHDRTAEASVIESAKTEANLKYLKALYVEELSNTEILSHFRKYEDKAPAEETISRKLNELRKSGLTDFRKNGRQVKIFLTPLARSILDDYFPEAHKNRLLGCKNPVFASIEVEPRFTNPPHLEVA